MCSNAITFYRITVAMFTLLIIQRSDARTGKILNPVEFTAMPGI